MVSWRNSCFPRTLPLVNVAVEDYLLLQTDRVVKEPLLFTTRFLVVIARPRQIPFHAK